MNNNEIIFTCIILILKYKKHLFCKWFDLWMVTVGANCLEVTVKIVWIGPMAQSEDINQSEDS